MFAVYPLCFLVAGILYATGACLADGIRRRQAKAEEKKMVSGRGSARQPQRAERNCAAA